MLALYDLLEREPVIVMKSSSSIDKCILFDNSSQVVNPSLFSIRRGFPNEKDFIIVNLWLSNHILIASSIVIFGTSPRNRTGI